MVKSVEMEKNIHKISDQLKLFDTKEDSVSNKQQSLIKVITKDHDI